jgi:hypothetical protein
MTSARISPWNNSWTQIFDFTPDKSGSGQLNYKIMENNPNEIFMLPLKYVEYCVKTEKGEGKFNAYNSYRDKWS